jgi:hypothetical protein
MVGERLAALLLALATARVATRQARRLHYGIEIL